MEENQLSPSRSSAAIGSLSSAIDGLRAVKNATIPGKLSFTTVSEMLMALARHKEKLPAFMPG
jgi:hypothetical protein